MSYGTFVKLQDSVDIKRPVKDWRTLSKRALFRLVIIMLAYGFGFATVVVLLSGCGETVREAGLGTLRTSAALMRDSGRILVNGGKAFGSVSGSPGGSLPPSNRGSMATDNVPYGDQPVTINDVMSYLQEHNIDVGALREGGW